MKKLFKSFTAFLIVVLGIVSLVAIAAPASAVTGRTPQPGPGFRYGIATSTLFDGAPSGVCNFSEAGGWDKPVFTSTGNGYLTDKTGQSVLPRTAALSEPCRNGTFSATNLRVQLALYGAGYSASVAGYTAGIFASGCSNSSSTGQAASYYCPNVTQNARCATSEWSSTQTVLAANVSSFGAIGGIVTQPQIGSPLRTNVAFGASPVASGTCTYLVELKLNVCYFVNSTLAGIRCETSTWTAERAFRAVPYGYPNLEQMSCDYNWDQPDCYLVDPEGFDGTDFDTVCTNPPVFVWGDWDWLNDAIGYYSRCLFFPQAGWDPGDLIPTAWEGTAFYQSGAFADSTIRAFTFYESCGVILDAVIPQQFGDLGRITINTCDYSTQFAEGKNILRYTFIIMFVIWVVGFVIEAASSISDRRMPNIWFGRDDL